MVYTGMNVDFLKYFLVKNKYKVNGKMKTKDNMRKYKDVIMWGCSVRNKILPVEFYTMWENYLKGFKKEFIANKRKGNVDEESEDPIPKLLYNLILGWLLENNNILVWVWTLLQWNLMARSASVDPLRLGNF